VAEGDDDKPDYLGHRQRLRDRFFNGGDGSLPDYELLELLLAQAQRRIDTKPIAKALIKRFGTFAGVMAATPEQLQKVDGVGHFGRVLFMVFVC
jgi:DNA repair protein RadC